MDQTNETPLSEAEVTLVQQALLSAASGGHNVEGLAAALTRELLAVRAAQRNAEAAPGTKISGEPNRIGACVVKTAEPLVPAGLPVAVPGRVYRIGIGSNAWQGHLGHHYEPEALAALNGAGRSIEVEFQVGYDGKIAGATARPMG